MLLSLHPTHLAAYVPRQICQHNQERWSVQIHYPHLCRINHIKVSLQQSTHDCPNHRQALYIWTSGSGCVCYALSHGTFKHIGTRTDDVQDIVSAPKSEPVSLEVFENPNILGICTSLALAKVRARVIVLHRGLWIEPVEWKCTPSTSSHEALTQIFRSVIVMPIPR